MGHQKVYKYIFMIGVQEKKGQKGAERLFQ